jgi:hypothetical protein
MKIEELKKRIEVLRPMLKDRYKVETIEILLVRGGVNKNEAAI